MRRFAIATLAGFALLAGQAAAANQGPDLRVGDRVGPTKGATKNFGSLLFDFGAARPTTTTLLFGGVAIGAGLLLYSATKKDSSP